MSQWRAVIDVPASVHGPAAARQVVAALLPMWDIGHVTANAQLIVSELVTNAYQHAPGADSFELELLGYPERLRIVLADGSAVRPVIAELDETRPTGRGMRIVSSLATEWGAEDHHGGKRVWVDLTLRPATH
jgi:anti-sigma regulatory factor (Ser/Thr protein kinase)